MLQGIKNSLVGWFSLAMESKSDRKRIRKSAYDLVNYQKSES